jgi:hypothetical protein
MRWLSAHEMAKAKAEREMDWPALVELTFKIMRFRMAFLMPPRITVRQPVVRIEPVNELEIGPWDGIYRKKAALATYNRKGKTHGQSPEARFSLICQEFGVPYVKPKRLTGSEAIARHKYLFNLALSGGKPYNSPKNDLAH